MTTSRTKFVVPGGAGGGPSVGAKTAVDRSRIRQRVEESDDWREELYQDYVGPIIVHDEGGNRKGLTDSHGFIPKRRSESLYLRAVVCLNLPRHTAYFASAAFLGRLR